MAIGVMLGLFSQITGINAIIYYAPEIFKATGIGAGSAFYQTFLIGIINTIFTFVALWLIDRAGRRKLLLVGVAGMIICLFGTGICFYFDVVSGPWLLLFILGYIACFASSLGPIPWIIMSEIFPTKTRGVAMSMVTFVLWIGVVLVTQLTPVMLESFGGAFTFWLFMINAIILLIFSWLKVPESKNRTLEDIERSWKQI
jgi:SP family arabinose:H+ symporter-like MFS transporter